MPDVGSMLNAGFDFWFWQLLTDLGQENCFSLYLSVPICKDRAVRTT